MTSLKIYLQQSHRFQDFPHSDKSAKKTSYARKCTEPLAQRYKAKQVLRQNSTMSIKLFDFLFFMWFLDFWHIRRKNIDKKQQWKNKKTNKQNHAIQKANKVVCAPT